MDRSCWLMKGVQQQVPDILDHFKANRVLLFGKGVELDLSICALLHTLLCSNLIYKCTCVCVSHVSGSIRGKGDVIFDDIIADVQGVQISGRSSSEQTLHSCPSLSVRPPSPLFRCASSANV